MDRQRLPPRPPAGRRPEDPACPPPGSSTTPSGSSSSPGWLGHHPPWLRYLIVLVALGLIVYEAVARAGEPRWTLLVLYTGMIGLTSLAGVGRPTLERRP